VNAKQNTIKMINNVIYVLFISQIVINAPKQEIYVQDVIQKKTENNNLIMKVNVTVLIFIIKIKTFVHYVTNIKNVYHVITLTHVINVMIKIIGLSIKIINVNVLKDIMNKIINVNYVMLLDVHHVRLIINVINV
jgi:hypothetical protein